MTSPALPTEPATSKPAFVRDSLFAERVRWSGVPKKVIASAWHKSLARILAGFSLISTLLAIAASEAGHMAVGRLILFAAWTATFSLLIRMIPVLWAQAARFVVTDRHVIWTRGKLKRTIQRDGISFARITWNRKNPRVGDLELVRAVPTGALHRKLTLTLQGVSSPHRVWTIIRGARAVTGLEGGGDVSPDFRLDEGEELRWSSGPMKSWKAWLPMSARRSLTTAFGVLCVMASVRTILVAWALWQRLVEGGISTGSLSFISLASAMVLTSLLLGAMGGWMLHVGLTRKPWIQSKTKYFVTNHRIIIERGWRELHLDRKAVVDLVDKEGLYGGRDAFFVLDGPHSRALSAQGAFGPSEGVKGFRPMFQSLSDEDMRTLKAELSRR